MDQRPKSSLWNERRLTVPGFCTRFFMARQQTQALHRHTTIVREKTWHENKTYRLHISIGLPVIDDAFHGRKRKMTWKGWKQKAQNNEERMMPPPPTTDLVFASKGPRDDMQVLSMVCTRPRQSCPGNCQSMLKWTMRMCVWCTLLRFNSGK